MNDGELSSNFKRMKTKALLTPKAFGSKIMPASFSPPEITVRRPTIQNKRNSKLV